VLLGSKYVNRKYQVAIPKQTREVLNISYGGELIVSVEDGKIIMKPKPKNYTNYMRGLHKEVWKDVEAAEYIEEERKHGFRARASLFSSAFSLKDFRVSTALSLAV
jgi:AbrB family looped-hinge helix DNA binding protein